VKSALTRIQSVLQLKAMPPSGPLSNAESDFVLRWISEGAPEVASSSVGTTASGSPSPQVSSEPDETTDEPTSVPSGVVNGSIIGFKQVYQNVFRPHCVSCHGSSGGVNLNNYSSVVSVVTKIKSALLANRMPPRTPLEASKKALVLEWIQNGAPENPVSPSPNPSPAPQPSDDPADLPLVPTFRSIQARIFVQKCVGCHDGSGGRSDLNSKSHGDDDDEDDDEHEASRINLNSLSWIKASHIIDLKRPEKSELIEVLRRGRMPPVQSGQGPLAAEEVNVIESWIRSGLPE